MPCSYITFTESETHSLCGATQCHIRPPRLIPLAAHTEPGLGIIDCTGTSLQTAKSRRGKVRVWVTGTMVRVETNGVDIIQGWPGKGELNRILLWHEGTRTKMWLTCEKRKYLSETFTDSTEGVNHNYKEWKKRTNEYLPCFGASPSGEDRVKSPTKY